ncbi:MAG TPA: DUF190 domain-containing protein [Terriglobales bacterium]
MSSALDILAIAAHRDDVEQTCGGPLPFVVIFVDTDEHVNRVLPTLKEMAAHRPTVRENVVLDQGNLG